jgi:hypothetical protein
VRKLLLAAVVATTPAIAIPTVAAFAQQAGAPPAPAASTGEHSDQERVGPGPWMRGEGGGGMHRWGGMRHGMMMRRDPQERCTDRLAWRAAMRAYTEVKLNLTPEQRPLWDRLQNIAQTGEQKERQLCSSLKSDGEATMLDRLDRMQQFMSTRLETLQAAKPAVQALYQSLSPEQRAIFDHPFRR